MGVLPDIKALVAWIPIDEAAKAIVEMTLGSSHRSRSSTPRYRHIVHPRPVAWLDVWKLIALDLEQLSSKPIRLVSYDDWLKALLQVASASANNDSMRAARQANPAIKLVDSTFNRFSCAHFEQLGGGKGAEAVDSLGGRRLRTRLSEGESYVLSHVNRLGKADVEAWIQGWIREGFIPRPRPNKL
jgi:hypothetical protein